MRSSNIADFVIDAKQQGITFSTVDGLEAAFKGELDTAAREAIIHAKDALIKLFETSFDCEANGITVCEKKELLLLTNMNVK